jgi:hypothetical protein
MYIISLLFHIAESSVLPTAPGDDNSLHVVIFIEVQLQRSKRKDKSRDLRDIRQAIINILNEKTELHTILKDNYTVEIIEVESNPLQIKIKVKSETILKKVKKDCQNRKLSQIIKDHIAQIVGKEVQYELKFRVQKVSELPQARLTNAQQVSTNSNSTVNGPHQYAQSGTHYIIGNVIFDIIKNKEYTVYDFYSTLVKYKDKTDLSSLLSDTDGYNLLHAVIVFNRLPLLLPLVHLKLWRTLMQGTIPLDSASSFRGHTPRLIAEAKRSKRFKDEVTNHDQVVNSTVGDFRTFHSGSEVVLMNVGH